MVRDLQNFFAKKTVLKIRVSAVAKGKKMIILLVDFRPFLSDLAHKLITGLLAFHQLVCIFS
jgi:hypothetical protein